MIFSPFSLYSAELNSRLTISKMKQPLDSVKALLEHPDMEFFFNNAEAFKKSLKTHSGKQTQELHAGYVSDASGRPVFMITF